MDKKSDLDMLPDKITSMIEDSLKKNPEHFLTLLDS